MMGEMPHSKYAVFQHLYVNNKIVSQWHDIDLHYLISLVRI